MVNWTIWNNGVQFLTTQTCPKLALAFREQLFEQIPKDEHDVTLDCVIYFTDKEEPMAAA